MLVLLFNIGGTRFAVEARKVSRVLTCPELMPASGERPSCLLGFFDYHGVLVPVADLRSLTAGMPCPDTLGNRIMLLKTAGGGLLAARGETMTETALFTPEMKTIGAVDGTDGLTAAVYRHPTNGLTALLDTDALFQSDDIKKILAMSAGGS